MNGYTKTQMFVFGAVVALFVAVVIPAFFRKPKTTVLSQDQAPSHFGSNPNLRGNPQEKPAGPKEKGWAATLAPYYSLGVFGYVLYIMYRISRKKHSPTSPPRHTAKIMSPLASADSNRRGGNQRTKITSYELNQLEEKLNESEKAVERILETANKVIAEVYQREMEADDSDSTLSIETLSSEEQPKITEIEDDYDSTSSDSIAENYQNGGYDQDGYDTYSDSGDTETSSSENEESNLTSTAKLPKQLNREIRGPPKFVNSVEDVAKEDICSSESHQSPESEQKNTIQSVQIRKENLELLHTTKEVMKAMSEIKTYIKEHK